MTHLKIFRLFATSHTGLPDSANSYVIAESEFEARRDAPRWLQEMDEMGDWATKFWTLHAVECNLSPFPAVSAESGK